MDLTCDRCKEPIDRKVLCDNDCGTIFCPTCVAPMYWRSLSKEYISGHNPECMSASQSRQLRDDPDLLLVPRK